MVSIEEISKYRFDKYRKKSKTRACIESILTRTENLCSGLADTNKTLFLKIWSDT